MKDERIKQFEFALWSGQVVSVYREKIDRKHWDLVDEHPKSWISNPSYLNLCGLLPLQWSPSNTEKELIEEAKEEIRQWQERHKERYLIFEQKKHALVNRLLKSYLKNEWGPEGHWIVADRKKGVVWEYFIPDYLRYGTIRIPATKNNLKLLNDRIDFEIEVWNEPTLVGYDEEEFRTEVRWIVEHKGYLYVQRTDPATDVRETIARAWQKGELEGVPPMIHPIELYEKYDYFLGSLKTYVYFLTPDGEVVTKDKLTTDKRCDILF